jgi:hypothetical protein
MPQHKFSLILLIVLVQIANKMELNVKIISVRRFQFKLYVSVTINTTYLLQCLRKPILFAICNM